MGKNIILVLSLLIAGAALAQGAPVPPPSINQVRQEIKDVRQETKEQAGQIRVEAKTEVKNIRTTATSSGKTRESAREEVKQKIEDASDKIKNLRDERKAQEDASHGATRGSRESIWRRSTAEVIGPTCL